MKNYYCTLCGYRYVSAFEREEDEENVRRLLHPDKDQFAAFSSDNSDFRLLSDAWRCPHCGALKRFFRPEPDRRPPHGF